jgi:lambda repressor-like predicted transcriptional regulator
MGSIDAVGGGSLAASWGSTQTTGTQGTQGGHRHHHHGGGAPESAAKALGMSDQDVSAALQSGTSLDDLAQQKGVSHDDLISAIKAGLPAGVEQSGRADQIAQSIATLVGSPRPSVPPPGGSSGGSDSSAVSGVLGSSLDAGQRATLDGLSSLLGTTSDDLLASLRGGGSLAQLVDDKGVDRDQLASVLQDGLMVDTSA